MTLPAKALDQHIIILGKTRSGKSSVMRKLVEGLLTEAKPICIIDPKGDWWGLKSSADGKRAGFPVIIFGGEHADVPINAHSGPHVAELVATGNRPCIIDLGGWMPDARTRFFIEFASILFRSTRGQRWIAIDECHNFCPKGKVWDPDAGKMLHWANRLASEGAGKGLNLISASQRPQKVHNDYLSSHETLIALRVIHKADRDATKDWIDGCADPEKGKEVLSTLASMKRGQGWVWSPEIGFGPEIVQFPMFTTYDSFKAPTGEPVGKLKGWASVDLDEVRAKLATVVEEAKANDPRELKAEIARLKAELSKGVSISSPSNEGAKSNIPLLKAEFAKGLEQGHEAGFAEGLRAGCHIGEDAIVVMGQAIHAALRDAPKDIAARRAECTGQRKPTPQRKTSALRAVVDGAQPRSLTGRASAFDAERPGSSPGGAGQRILDGLAELEALGVKRAPRVLAAFLAGYSHLQSKGFVNALGALRTARLVDYPAGESAVFLTDDGRAQANQPSAPLSTSEIQQRIMSLLGGASSKILAPLIEAYPNSLLRDEVALHAGYGHLQSKGFVNALGRMKTLGFVEYPGSGQVRASDLLFP